MLAIFLHKLFVWMVFLMHTIAMESFAKKLAKCLAVSSIVIEANDIVVKFYERRTFCK